MQKTSFLVLLLVLVSGCAHTRLAFHSPRHAQTLTEIAEQQVLDNLAMQLNSPGSTPYFALPNGGGAQTSQSAALGGSLTWNPTTLVSETASANSAGGLNENWTVKPVLEPERVIMMKCLLAHVTGDYQAVTCDECYLRLTNFFGADFAQQIPSRFYSVSGKKPHVWFRDCCIKYGHHCGTYVSVDHDAYECLSRVTIAFLDIATADASAFVLPSTGEKTIEIEETFGYGNRTIKARREVTISQYEAMLGIGQLETMAAPPSSVIPAPTVPFSRPRRDTGSSVESLLQLNLGR